MHEELFSLAQNIQEPWIVKRVEFDKNLRSLDFWIYFVTGSRFKSTECFSGVNIVHDTNEIIRRHLNFVQNETYFDCRLTRLICESCGVHQVHVPWAWKQNEFILLMNAMILLMAGDMPVANIEHSLEWYCEFIQIPTVFWRDRIA